ncbi:hypothetical protein [Gryllotalpicola kribbensis]|uniref:hypothetical protein n=1 Tax=Gryllotalpicola kribbensis TaxID=993084 RepID=UPI0031CDF604
MTLMAIGAMLALRAAGKRDTPVRRRIGFAILAVVLSSGAEIFLISEFGTLPEVLAWLQFGVGMIWISSLFLLVLWPFAPLPQYTADDALPQILGRAVRTLGARALEWTRTSARAIVSTSTLPRPIPMLGKRSWRRSASLLASVLGGFLAVVSFEAHLLQSGLPGDEGLGLDRSTEWSVFNEESAVLFLSMALSVTVAVFLMWIATTLISGRALVGELLRLGSELVGSGSVIGLLVGLLLLFVSELPDRVSVPAEIVGGGTPSVLPLHGFPSVIDWTSTLLSLSAAGGVAGLAVANLAILKVILTSTQRPLLGLALGPIAFAAALWATTRAASPRATYENLVAGLTAGLPRGSQPLSELIHQNWRYAFETSSQDASSLPGGATFVILIAMIAAGYLWSILWAALRASSRKGPAALAAEPTREPATPRPIT